MIILLSGHCIKLPFKYVSLSPQISCAVPGPHQRRFFVEWIAVYEETHDWPKCRDCVSGGLSHTGTSLAYLFSQGPQTIEEGQVERPQETRQDKCLLNMAGPLYCS